MAAYQKPCYSLQRVYDSGEKSTPRVYRLDNYNPSGLMGRRDFLKTSVLPLSPLLVAACGGGSGGNGGSNLDPEETNAEFRADVKAHFGLRKALFSPDGQLIASIGDDAQLKIWQLDNQLLTSFTIEDEIRDFEFAADSSFVAIATPFNVTIYDLSSFALLHTFDVIDIDPVRAFAEVRNLAVSGSGQIIVGTHKGVYHWTYPGGVFQGGFDITPGFSFYMRLRPQGDAVIVANGNGKVEVYDFPSGNLQAAINISGAFLIDLNFSPDGRYFVVTETARPNKIIVYDYASLTRKFRVRGSFDVDDIHHFLRLIFVSDGRLVSMVNRNASGGQWVPSAIIVDLDTELVTEANGLIGLDVISPNSALYLSDGLHVNWLGGSNCGTNQKSQLILGRIDLTSATPQILDGWHLYSPDATDTDRKTRLHSTLYHQGQIIYVASSPALPLDDGSVCTCNTVSGTGVATVEHCGSGSSGGSCTCNTVCICVPVFF